MAPISQPGPPQPPPQFCPRCRIPLSQPMPPYCPNCGMVLQQRPVWITVLVSLAAGFLGLAGLAMGGFGACMAFIVLASAQGGLNRPDTQWVWGVLATGVVCIAAAVALLVWLVKKPKP